MVKYLLALILLGTAMLYPDLPNGQISGSQIMIWQMNRQNQETQERLLKQRREQWDKHMDQLRNFGPEDEDPYVYDAPTARRWDQ